MSDYYGMATLEDWLAEEVFMIDEAPEEVVSLFEVWRSRVEYNIDAWLMTDDGEGNNTSWRGWGRGFDAILDDEDDFCDAVTKGQEILDRSRENEQKQV